MNERKARRAAQKALEALYASLPHLSCRGLCSDSCYVTDDLMSGLELYVLSIRLGHDPGFLDETQLKVGDDLSADCMKCPLLTTDGRCSQYDLRPLICRLWGMVDDPLMICPYGCKPARYLSNGEVARIWIRLTEIDRRYRAAIKCDDQSEIHEGDEH